METSGKLFLKVKIGYFISEALWEVVVLEAVVKADTLDRADMSGRMYFSVHKFDIHESLRQ